MAIVTIRIPQMGEGLQEARLVAMLKQAGDPVRRDEPIYQMETDKAVMDVESPFAGTLVEWLANADDILPIGAEVARMEVSDADAAGESAPAAHGAPISAPTGGTPAHDGPAIAAGARNASVPPRTRQYAKDKGLGDDELLQIPAPTGKLMPADVDAYLANRSGTATFDDRPLPPKQRLLASRLVRGNQLVVPGTMSVVTNWGPVETLRAEAKSRGDEFQPSAFTMLAFAVAQVLKDFPVFRSTLVGDNTLRTYRTVNIGVAVALPGDELVLAVLDDADTFAWRDFAGKLRERIDLARSGVDQAKETVPISLTNMQAFGLRDAIPVVVPPAVSTLFIGEAYNGLSNDAEAKVQRSCNLTLTFDHRVANGVGAAEFLNAIRAKIEAVGEWAS
ncbi:MAG: 2-oxo acid dehydrogenase subunit E2 [Fimbriimonadaceae bacterium]|nr:2-oxo acid dehydrogenase subunit E2 [Fimbriimonadaceae bacterium]